MHAIKKILVVEDEKSLRAAIVYILLLKNFLPIEAKNGREGVDLAIAEHPDLILLDLIMPEMDGMIALKKIRQDDWGKTVPIIILTNLSEPNEPIVNDPVTHYLIKSDCKLHDVMKKIKEILETQKAS